MIQKNKPSKYYESGYNEIEKGNLFDSLVFTDLENIFKSIDNSQAININLNLIIDKINNQTYSFDNFAKNEEIRHSFSTIFYNTLKNNDVNNVCLFLEQPLVRLVNFYNKELEFSKYAINYLIKYISSYKIEKINLNSFFDHIKKIMEHCSISEMHSDFYKLKEFLFVFNQNIDKVCPKNLHAKVKKFFNDIINGNLNQNKDLKEEYHKVGILKDIVEYTGILFDMSSDKSKNKDEQYKLLSSVSEMFKKEFDVKKDRKLLNSLGRNEHFCRRVEFLLNYYFKNKHWKNIDVILNSLYSEFIDFKDDELRISAYNYLKESIKNKEEKDKKFIHHIKLIDKKFEFSKIKVSKS